MAKKNKRKVSSGTGRPAQAPVATPVAEPVARPTSRAVSSYSPATRRTTGLTTEFNPDYTYVVHDLKRIGILAGSFVALLIALSFIL